MLDKFRSLLIQWIVYCHIAFSLLENNYFRRLLRVLTFLNPPLGELSAQWYGVMFRKWALAEFRTQKERVKKELRSARSNIHLSFDCWTSPNAYSMIAVISHFIDSKGRRQTKLLAVRRERSGENMGACVFQVIREYGIQKRIGFFVLGNVASNDVSPHQVLVKAADSMKSINSDQSDTGNNSSQNPKFLLRLYDALAHDKEISGVQVASSLFQYPTHYTNVGVFTHTYQFVVTKTIHPLSFTNPNRES
jgi:hypothetical protein